MFQFYGSIFVQELKQIGEEQDRESNQVKITEEVEKHYHNLSRFLIYVNKLIQLLCREILVIPNL